MISQLEKSIEPVKARETAGVTSMMDRGLIEKPKLLRRELQVADERRKYERQPVAIKLAAIEAKVEIVATCGEIGTVVYRLAPNGRQGGSNPYRLPGRPPGSRLRTKRHSSTRHRNKSPEAPEIARPSAEGIDEGENSLPRPSSLVSVKKRKDIT